MDRLNIQAHKNALHSTDEFVMNEFVVQDKVSLLVADLLTTEAWNSYIFPLVKKQLSTISSLRGYLLLYHEASLINLLEVMLYHRTACESSDDAIVELVDYCYRKLLWLTQAAEKKHEAPIFNDPKKVAQNNSEQELERQSLEIKLSCAMCSLSLIRFITDHVQGLSIQIVHQMMEKCDIPLVLVPLLEMAPWKRVNSKGENEKFEDNKWVVVLEVERERLCKMEAQIWLTIYNLFMSREANRKYEITTFRKQNLLRLRKFLTPALIDQLPILTDFHRSIEELQLMQENSVASTNPFIVESIPQIRQGIVKGKDWKEIAEYQTKMFFVQDEESLKEDMERLMKIYNSEMFEEFMDEPKCASCGKTATNRCSKCKNQWYCSRDCQLRCWKDHKALCSLFTSNKKEDEQRAQEVKKQVVGEKKKPLIQEL